MTVRIALCHSCVELTTVGLKGWIACFTGQGQMCQLYLNNYSNHLNHAQVPRCYFEKTLEQLLWSLKNFVFYHKQRTWMIFWNSASFVLC